MSQSLVDVTVDSIAAGGDGVARSAGLVVFLPRTAPGDRGRARLEPRGRLARGEMIALDHPSEQRVEPPCSHYTRDRCGGCQLQHLRYDAQLDAKRGIVRDSLQRIARRDADVPPVVASDREWRYRRKLTLALRRRGARWIAGLHPYDAPGRVFELADCPITDERVVEAWREIMRAAALLPDGATELRGAVRLLDEGVSFVLEGGRRWTRWQEFATAAPSVTSLWWVGSVIVSTPTTYSAGCSITNGTASHGRARPTRRAVSQVSHAAAAQTATVVARIAP